MIDDFLTADIGNSRIKLQSNKRYLALDYKKGWLDSVRKFTGSYSCGMVVYSSVNEPALTELTDFIPEIQFIDATTILEQEKIIRFRHIAGIGPDRIFGLAGALRYARPPLITVDCGTAVTVNAIDEEKYCLGGAIMPGFFTQVKSLGLFTGGINEVRPAFLLNSGKNTEDAVGFGVTSGVVGGIALCVNILRAEIDTGKEISVFITGGYATDIAPFLMDENVIIKENLVLDGIRFIYQNS